MTKVENPWVLLQSFPLEMVAAGEGKSVKSFLSDATGLSPAHVSTKGLEIKSTKRLNRLNQEMLHRARSGLSVKGYSTTEIEQCISDCPQTALAGLAYFLGHAGSEALTLAISVGARLDRLAMEALKCIEKDEILPYKRLLLDFLDEERRSFAGRENLAGIDEVQQVLMAANDWSSLRGPSNKVAEYTLLATLAAVDVEWGARYFGRLAPTPTFLWLAPQFHPDFDAANSKGLKRDVLKSPVGKLFDLLWAVTKRGASGGAEWPANPPGPSALAKDINHVQTGDNLIRKWTSGAKPLRTAQVTELWASLNANLCGGETFEVPLPWIAVALWMERALVRRTLKPKSSKPGTVIFLSDIAYQAIWTEYRRRWAEQLPEPGNLPWPQWLLAQSAWPDWMRCSQSSGRESSPRDCQ